RSMKKWNGEGGRKMPNGVNLGMILAVIIPLFIVTVALRALPFSLLRYLTNSEFMAVLGGTMHVGVMTVLVVYIWYGKCEFRGGFVAVDIVVAATYLLHKLHRDVDLSILVGTINYMLLVNLVF